MALSVKRQQINPDTPIQILNTKKGQVRVNGKFWIVSELDQRTGQQGVSKIILLTPEGGYRYPYGPIRSDHDLKLIDVKEDREKALEWWANKDKWQDTAPRKIGFEQGTGYPIFEDTKEYVEDDAVLQAYWPEGDILYAAIRANGKRKDAKVALPVALKVVEGVAPVPKVEVPAAVAAPVAMKRTGFTKEQLAKSRATKAANKAKKAAEAAAPATE